jgi:hypothetical protein
VLSRKPNTLRFVLALFIADVGAWINYVALSVLVYQRTGSPLLATAGCPAMGATLLESFHWAPTDAKLDGRVTTFDSS